MRIGGAEKVNTRDRGRAVTGYQIQEVPYCTSVN